MQLEMLLSPPACQDAQYYGNSTNRDEETSRNDEMRCLLRNRRHVCGTDAGGLRECSRSRAESQKILN
jgi:hypothetical protein